MLYGASAVLFGGGLKWNFGDRKLAIIVFVNENYLGRGTV